MKKECIECITGTYHHNNALHILHHYCHALRPGGNYNNMDI